LNNFGVDEFQPGQSVEFDLKEQMGDCFFTYVEDIYGKAD